MRKSKNNLGHMCGDAREREIANLVIIGKKFKIMAQYQILI